MNPWLAPLLAQLVSVNAGDRTEARVRVDESVVRYDAESLAWTALRVESKLAELELGYGFLLSGLALGTDDQEIIGLHSQSLGAGFRLRRTVFSLQQAGSYGEQNFRSLSVTPRSVLSSERSALSPPTGGGAAEPAEPGPRAGLGGTLPPPEAQPILIDEPVKVGSLVAALGMTSLLSRRFSLTAYAGYDYSGGLDEVSRLVYPVYYGPFASLGASYRLSPSDGVSAFVTGRRSTNLDEEDAQIVALEGRWSHRFTPNLETEIGAGVSAIDSDVEADGSNLPPVLPVGFAAFSYRSRIAFEVSVTTATLIVTPGLDRLTGIVDERAELRVEQRWSDGEFDLVGGAAGSQSLSSAGLTLATLGADAFTAWHFAPHFAIEPGFRMYWQKYAELDPLFAYALYVAFRVSTE